MIQKHVALISESKSVNHVTLHGVATALTRQATTDFAPIWGVGAVVTAFESVQEIPAGYWSIVLVDSMPDAGALGEHLDTRGVPYALVEVAPNWSITASHELLEMLADPLGNRTAVGPSIADHSKRVKYLIEVCDPVENFSYKIGSFHVSDFVFPTYFGMSLSAHVPAGHFSFLGKVHAPLTLAQGGYISWLDPADNHWYQATDFGTFQVSDLGLDGRHVDASQPHPGRAFVRDGIYKHGKPAARNTPDFVAPNPHAAELATTAKVIPTAEVKEPKPEPKKKGKKAEPVQEPAPSAEREQPEPVNTVQTVVVTEQEQPVETVVVTDEQ